MTEDEMVDQLAELLGVHEDHQQRLVALMASCGPEVTKRAQMKLTELPLMLVSVDHLPGTHTTVVTLQFGDRAKGESFARWLRQEGRDAFRAWRARGNC